MQQKAVKEEADRLVCEYGTEAYSAAREAMRLAKQRKNSRLERYFAKIAVEIARREKRVVGLDTQSLSVDHFRQPLLRHSRLRRLV